MATKAATKTPAPTAERKTRTVDAHGRRVKTAGEPTLARYAEVEPTALQNSFADWLTENTGYKVDPQSVALATALRGQFQKSPENQADLKARREAAAAAKEERAQRIEDRKNKPVAPKKAAKPVVEEEEEEAAPVVKKPARKAPTAAAKTATAKTVAAAKPKRRRAPAGAAALEEEI